MFPKFEADEPLPLGQVAALLPRRGKGKIHKSTLYRWSTKGCRGIVLDYVEVGHCRCVTKQMLEDFFARLTKASKDKHRGADATIQTSARRRRAAEGATRELDRQGI